MEGVENSNEIKRESSATREKRDEWKTMKREGETRIYKEKHTPKKKNETKERTKKKELERSVGIPCARTRDACQEKETERKSLTQNWANKRNEPMS